MSLRKEDAAEHFGWFKDFAMIDTPASSEITKARLGWKPMHVDLLTDLKTNVKS